MRRLQCKFCNYNATYDDARAVGTNLAIASNIEDTVEAFKIVSSEVRPVEGRWQSGALSSGEQEAATHLSFVERIASAASYAPNTTMSTQPASRQGLQRLKDAGLTCIHFNAEVWGADLFAEVCPGKAKHRGFERYQEAYLKAVQIFGDGGARFGGHPQGGRSEDNGH